MADRPSRKDRFALVPPSRVCTRSMALLIFYIFLAIAVSFACSIMEAVLLSVTPGYLATLEQGNDPVAGRLKALKEDVDKPLAAILTLNTIAHTVGAAGAGAQAAAVFGDKWIGLFSAVLTLAILFLSEIIPKTIGAMHWKRLSGVVTRALQLLMPPLKPFVWLSGLTSRLIASGHGSLHVSRAELRALADLGAKQGVLDESESRILRALLRFRSLRAVDIMTPRTVLFTLPGSLDLAAAAQAATGVGFSRIPIHDDSVDKMEGYVLRHELLDRVARGEHDGGLRGLRRELIFVPRETSLSELLERFLGAREHIALVVDEYGGTAGVVTLEDVVETLLDMEIVDEVDDVADLREAARKDWQRRARKLGLVPEPEA